MISALLALISYVIVILVGLTCLAVEEKMHMLISQKKSFLYFLYRFFCKCILKCPTQNRMRADFSFSNNFGQKMWLKEGYAEKKSFLMSFQGHLRSIKVIWVYWFFCIPIGYHVVKNDENMKMSYKDMPTYALNFAIWAHLAPQWFIWIPHMFFTTSINRAIVLANNLICSKNPLQISAILIR